MGALISGIFQLIVLHLNNAHSIKKHNEEYKKLYNCKKEEVYISAIERLQQIRKGFDLTYEYVLKHSDIRENLQKRDLEYENISAKLRLYSSDDIFSEYYRLTSYKRYAYVRQFNYRLSENEKDAFSRQVLVLSRRMQDDLGFRPYNKNNVQITCPECGTVHDAFSKCSKCNMRYEEYMERMKISIYNNENDVQYLSPNYKEGYDSYFLLKFIDSIEYVKDFLDGNLYFNTNDYFMLSDEIGRGDSSEGNDWIINPQKNDFLSANLRMIGGKPAIEVVDYSSDKNAFKEGTIYGYSSSLNRKRKLISFYTLYTDTLHNRIQEIPKQMAKEFGEYGILILDTVEFYNRLKEGLIKKEGAHEIQLGFVDYLKESDEHGMIKGSSFIKSSSFSYQNEFRATYIDEKEESDEPVKINVGDLRDIVVPISKDDIKNLYLENGKLFYPNNSIED